MGPKVIAMCGLPGSGKTTLARKLAAATGWTRVDRDELRRELFPDGGGYGEADKRRLGDRLLERLRTMLARSESAILDGMTLSRASERERFARGVRAAGGDWRLVWLDCDVAVAKARVEAERRHPAADRNAALVDDVARRFEAPAFAIRVRAADAPETQLRTVLAALYPERRRQSQ